MVKKLATFQSLDDRTLMLFYKNAGGTMDFFDDEQKAILRGEFRRRGLY